MTAAGLTYVLDANIILRLTDPYHEHHRMAQSATKYLRDNDVILRTLPQSLFEFWTVATRKRSQNGLGLSVVEAGYLVDSFTLAYWPIPDDPATLTFWRRLVERYDITGKNCHDARYIAAMQAHGLTHILTFDSNFNRYAAEGIVVVNPSSVVTPDN